MSTSLLRRACCSHRAMTDWGIPPIPITPIPPITVTPIPPITDRGITDQLHTLALLIWSCLASHASGSKITASPSPIMAVGTQELTPPHHHAPTPNASLLFLSLLHLLLTRGHWGACGVQVARVWPLHRLVLGIPSTGSSTCCPAPFAHTSVVISEGTVIMESRAL